MFELLNNTLLKVMPLETHELNQFQTIASNIRIKRGPSQR